jgi:nickel-dependent lactate racemase
MKTHIQYGSRHLEIEVPDNTTVYKSSYPKAPSQAKNIILETLRNPLGSQPLESILKKRRPGDVFVVVSDITRPIPYFEFLRETLLDIEAAGVARENILILIATGMHRPSTASERQRMFGDEICTKYRIIDHRADDESGFFDLGCKSWAGNDVILNRHFIEAGCRIVTGLVEPHFMAGFSGGRKAVCPGLSSLGTIHKFHGYEFLANPLARSGNLEGNPCHQEAVSIARAAGVDFTLNVVLDQSRHVVRAFAGGLEAAHDEACRFVLEHACPHVLDEHDIVLTGCGGAPLDATFYQCVKGMVSCLPAVKENGTIISVGSCSEGIGSEEYKQLMFRYSDRWKEFLEDIRTSSEVIKDQWQLQMQARALNKVGLKNIYFITDGLDLATAGKLSVNIPHVASGNVRETVQSLLDELLQQFETLAVIPEGPYCSPIS